MLPSDFKTRAPERKEYDPLPEDSYQVQISDINLKQSFNSFRNEQEDVLDFEFVVLDEGQYRSRRLWKTVRPVMVPASERGKASWLYVIANKIMGKEFSDEEINAFNPNDLIGEQLRVVVNQTQGKNGNTYNNIIGFQVKKGDLEPFEKSEPAKEEPPKAGGERETTIKAIFAQAKKLWPTLQASPSPKETLKKYVKEELGIVVASWSEAPADLINKVYMAMKNLEALRITDKMKKEQPEEEEVNVEDIPF